MWRVLYNDNLTVARRVEEIELKSVPRGHAFPHAANPFTSVLCFFSHRGLNFFVGACVLDRFRRRDHILVAACHSSLGPEAFVLVSRGRRQ